MRFSDLSWIKDFADRLGLVGIVFEKHDGTIKVIAEGEEKDLRKLARELEREEKSFSRVENFYEKWAEATGEFKEFSVSTREP